jgi:hypothetical protein
MTITLPLSLGCHPVPSLSPSSSSATTTTTSSETTPNIPAVNIETTPGNTTIPPAPRFAPRTFRKTLSTPVHRTFPQAPPYASSSSSSSSSHASSSSSSPLEVGVTGKGKGRPGKVENLEKDLLIPNLKRKLGVRSKTYEDLPASSSSLGSSSSAGPTWGSGSREGLGFGQVPDDVRYGLARTAQAVRRARRVIVVCGQSFFSLFVSSTLIGRRQGLTSCLHGLLHLHRGRDLDPGYTRFQIVDGLVQDARQGSVRQPWHEREHFRGRRE